LLRRIRITVLPSLDNVRQRTPEFQRGSFTQVTHPFSRKPGRACQASRCSAWQLSCSSRSASPSCTPPRQVPGRSTSHHVDQAYIRPSHISNIHMPVLLTSRDVVTTIKPAGLANNIGLNRSHSSQYEPNPAPRSRSRSTHGTQTSQHEAVSPKRPSYITVITCRSDPIHISITGITGVLLRAVGIAGLLARHPIPADVVSTSGLKLLDHVRPRKGLVRDAPYLSRYLPDQTPLRGYHDPIALGSIPVRESVQLRIGAPGQNLGRTEAMKHAATLTQNDHRHSPKDCSSDTRCSSH
jgi:hypothetical protein